MEWLWLIVSWVVGATALGVSICLAIQSRENLRFARSRLTKRPLAVYPARPAAVIVPCKGRDLQLSANLRRLFQQRYHPYELLLVVESDDDPAATIIDRLIDAFRHVRARRIVAGRATDSGQKVHNLCAAIAEVGPHVEVLAFADSDAQPRSDWLQRLAEGLDKPGVGAVTGYRWFVPVHATLPNLLLSSINASVAALLGPGGHNFVWGGSWAILRERFHDLGLPAGWKGTLSDDLVVTRLLKERGLKIVFEPNCLVASPLDIGAPQLTEFLRRQYLIGRCYMPRWWQVGLLGTTLLQIVFWGGLLGLTLGLSAGAWWTPLSAATCVALYALNVYRAWNRQQFARIALAPGQATAGEALFDLVCGPLSGLVNLTGLLASLVGHQVSWRGVRYRLLPGGQITSIEVSALGADPSESATGPSPMVAKVRRAS